MRPKILTPDGDCLIYEYTRLKSPEHLHASIEMVMPRKGTAHVILDERELAIHPGEMLVIFPGTPHSYPESEVCRGMILMFSPEILSRQELDFSSLRPESPVIRLDEQDRDVEYCLQRLAELAVPCTINVELASAYLSLLFLRILPSLQPKESTAPAVGDLLYRAMQYISQNVSAPLSIRGTARALGVNTYYLSHVLNQRLHMSFRAYLNALRIERARRLLRATSRPIEDIAAACGFSTLRTFDRVFAEICDSTPRDFRKATMKAALDSSDALPRELSPAAHPKRI